MKLLKLTSALIALIGALFGVVHGPTNFVRYFSSAVTSTADTVEDRLVPFSFKLAAEAASCDDMAFKRSVLKVEEAKLKKIRADAAKEMPANAAHLKELSEAAIDAKHLIDAMVENDQTSRIIEGRAISRDDLDALRRQLLKDAQSLDTAIANANSRVAALDSDIAGLERAVGELARAEADRRERLTGLWNDHQIIEARVVAAESRLDARGAMNVGDSAASAARRELDRDNAKLLVLEEKLGDAAPAASSYPLTADALRREVAKIVPANATAK